MRNNYIFQRLLATFDLSRNHELTARVFDLGGQHNEVSKSLVKAWRTHDVNSKHYRPMRDDALNMFLDGLQEASKQGLITIYLSENDDD